MNNCPANITLQPLGDTDMCVLDYYPGIATVSQEEYVGFCVFITQPLDGMRVGVFVVQARGRPDRLRTDPDL